MGATVRRNKSEAPGSSGSTLIPPSCKCMSRVPHPGHLAFRQSHAIQEPSVQSAARRHSKANSRNPRSMRSPTFPATRSRCHDSTIQHTHRSPVVLAHAYKSHLLRRRPFIPPDDSCMGYSLCNDKSTRSFVRLDLKIKAAIRYYLPTRTIEID